MSYTITIRESFGPSDLQETCRTKQKLADAIWSALSAHGDFVGDGFTTVLANLVCNAAADGKMDCTGDLARRLVSFIESAGEIAAHPDDVIL